MSAQYLLFESLPAAQSAVKEIDAFLTKQAGRQIHWGDAYEHPSEGLYVIEFDDRLKAISDSLKGMELIDAKRAAELGFYIGPLNGRFYKAIHKCTEALILTGQLSAVYGRAPFPLSRTLFLGAQSAIYAAYCSVRKIVRGTVAKALHHYADVETWWEKREEERYREGELLKYLHDLNNSEKHGLSTLLVPAARFANGKNRLLSGSTQYMGDAMGLRLSGEGIFISSQFEGGYEEWNMVADADLAAMGFTSYELTFSLLGLPDRHLGVALPTRDPVTVSRISVQYHRDLVRGAIKVWAGSDR